MEGYFRKAKGGGGVGGDDFGGARVLVLNMEDKETRVGEHRRDFLIPLSGLPWSFGCTTGGHHGGVVRA